MINIIYNSLSFDGCSFKNILCNGDSDSSSLITFTSNIYGNLFELKNSTIEDCKSNGDLIMIKGEKATMNFNNSKINNITSYGSLINNISQNVSITFQINIHYYYIK